MLQQNKSTNHEIKMKVWDPGNMPSDTREAKGISSMRVKIPQDYSQDHCMSEKDGGLHQ